MWMQLCECLIEAAGAQKKLHRCFLAMHACTFNRGLGKLKCPTFSSPCHSDVWYGIETILKNVLCERTAPATAESQTIQHACGCVCVCLPCSFAVWFEFYLIIQLNLVVQLFNFLNWYSEWRDIARHSCRSVSDPSLAYGHFVSHWLRRTEHVNWKILSLLSFAYISLSLRVLCGSSALHTSTTCNIMYHQS